MFRSDSSRSGTNPSGRSPCCTARSSRARPSTRSGRPCSHSSARRSPRSRGSPTCSSSVNCQLVVPGCWFSRTIGFVRGQPGVRRDPGPGNEDDQRDDEVPRPRPTTRPSWHQAYALHGAYPPLFEAMSPDRLRATTRAKLPRRRQHASRCAPSVPPSPPVSRWRVDLATDRRASSRAYGVSRNRPGVAH